MWPGKENGGHTYQGKELGDQGRPLPTAPLDFCVSARTQASEALKELKIARVTSKALTHRQADTSDTMLLLGSCNFLVVL